MTIAFDYGVVATFGSAVAGIPVKVDQCDELWFQYGGTAPVGTIIANGSVDGVNFTPIFFQTFNAATSPGTFVANLTAIGIGRILTGGLKFVRFDCSVFTSGSITITANGQKAS